MSDTFNYSLVKNEDNTYSIRSTVNSFNLNNITDKDVVSFYRSFSSSAAFDTGLLPVDGTGVLSIRSAGPSMQIAVQHKPGMYYINWGAYEGASSAVTYLLAQPYRLVIGDFQDGNLLGARTFYSTVPFTHPDVQLYHVNLPNINCKGYRGNAVGWICLYHNVDISSLPIGEKIAVLIQRCSGIETYNDANMSETDGPRFYSAHYGADLDYSYLWNPTSWENKSTKEGFDWTLNDNIWIPVKVSGLDSQDRHDPNGIPLTLGMALVGNYQAYYTDKEIPKAYNLFSRSDLLPTSAHVASYFKKSFASSKISYTYDPLQDSLASIANIREVNSNKISQTSLFDSSNDNSDIFVCSNCDGEYNIDLCTLVNGSSICEDCLNEHYIYIDSADSWFSNEDSDIVYDEDTSEYYHLEYDTIIICDSCDCSHYYKGKPFKNGTDSPLYPLKSIPSSFPGSEFLDYDEFCSNCHDQFIESIKVIHSDIASGVLETASTSTYFDKVTAIVSNSSSYDVLLCSCKRTYYVESFLDHGIDYRVTNFKSVAPYYQYVEHEVQRDENNQPILSFATTSFALCTWCSTPPVLKNNIEIFSVLENSTLCPCGIRNDKSQIEKCVSKKITLNDGKDYEIFNACSFCIVNRDPTDPFKVGEFQPYNQDLFDYSCKSGVFQTSPCVYSQESSAQLIHADESPF